MAETWVSQGASRRPDSGERYQTRISGCSGKQSRSCGHQARVRQLGTAHHPLPGKMDDQYSPRIQGLGRLATTSTPVRQRRIQG